MSRRRICIFAGTSEGREIAERLSAKGFGLVISVATEYGAELLEKCGGAEILTGRKDTEAIIRLLSGEAFAAVVDATHPYADIVTENIARACRETGTEYIRLVRGSTADVSDGIFVENTAACVEFLKQSEGNILLTTGSKSLPEFCADEALRERVYARVLPMVSSLEICQAAGIAPSHIFAMQGPFDEEMNIASLHFAHAKWLVTKDTGNAGGYEDKLRAAKKAGASVIIIGRPAQREGLAIDEACAYLERLVYGAAAEESVSTAESGAAETNGANESGKAEIREPDTEDRGRKTACANGKLAILAGIGMGGIGTRTHAVDEAVRRADCVIGAPRMLEGFDLTGKEVHREILSEKIAAVIGQTEFQTYAVLFSGDTGFYSGAKKLSELLRGIAEVTILPGVGSLSYFCSRLGRTWQDVKAVSLHGRDCSFVHEVRTNPAVFTLLGGNDGAKEALARLEAAGMGQLTAAVGERLGYGEEKITRGTVEELSGGSYDALSVLLVENPYFRDSLSVHGLPDEAFLRDEKTPMTKSEIRSISISKMLLTPSSVVYDVGAGSGSVSVECALRVPYGRVYAVEKKEDALLLLKKNADRFALSNMTIVPGTAPEALTELPAPTHAFIGGSSGNLAEIVDLLLEKNPEVRMVANAVTLETLAELTELLPQFECAEAVAVNVSRDRRAGRYHLMTAQNPVYVVTLQHRKQA